MNRFSVGFFFLLLVLSACNNQPAAEEEHPMTTSIMDEVSEPYVKLVLGLGLHDPDYVDAYYGPAEWRTQAENENADTATIKQRAEAL